MFKIKNIYIYHISNIDKIIINVTLFYDVPLVKLLITTDKREHFIMMYKDNLRTFSPIAMVT